LSAPHARQSERRARTPQVAGFGRGSPAPRPRDPREALAEPRRSSMPLCVPTALLRCGPSERRSTSSKHTSIADGSSRYGRGACAPLAAVVHDVCGRAIASSCSQGGFGERDSADLMPNPAGSLPPVVRDLETTLLRVLGSPHQEFRVPQTQSDARVARSGRTASRCFTARPIPLCMTRKGRHRKTGVPRGIVLSITSLAGRPRRAAAQGEAGAFVCLNVDL